MLAIYKEAKKLNIGKNNDDLNFIKKFIGIPYDIKEDKNYYDNMIGKFKKVKKYNEFILYYNNQWKKYIINGMLDYSGLSKEERSNSYIENYNRRIKLRLSKFLYGKNKCKISWPLFLYFITNEEDIYRTECYEKEQELEYKIIADNEEKSYNNEPELLVKNKTLDEKEIHFLKWVSNSCRYDTFFYLFVYTIMPYLNKNQDNYKDEILNNLKCISLELLQVGKDILDKGIWELLAKYKSKNFDLCNDLTYYKKFNSFLQCINLLKNNSNFCIRYKVNEGCSICTPPVISEQYYIPFIEISKKEILSKKSISEIINNLFINSSNVCIKCGYDQEKKIISQRFYKIYTERENPLFLFLVFEFLDENEAGFLNNLEQENRNFDNRIIYNKKIIEYLQGTFSVYKDEYKLVGTINTPTRDHYTGLIIDLNENILQLEKDCNYYYDDHTDDNLIKKVDDYKSLLFHINPYIALYVKIN